MKIGILLALFSLGACATYQPIPGGTHFQSWYHGQYKHSVWGLGQLAAYSDDGYVICGEHRVKVVPIFDDHIWAGYDPKPGQTQEEAAMHNRNVLAMFAKKGVVCRLPSGDAAAPN